MKRWRSVEDVARCYETNRACRVIDLLGEVALDRRGAISVQPLRHPVEHGSEQSMLCVEFAGLSLLIFGWHDEPALGGKRCGGEGQNC